MTLTAAMNEDDFLLETAGWARYYEHAKEIIQQAKAANLAEEPPREIVDNPAAFARWMEHCDNVYQQR